jgi:predicted nicotinamide N-methyase
MGSSSDEDDGVDTTLGYSRESYLRPTLVFGDVSISPLCQKELAFTDAMALVEGTQDWTGQLAWPGAQLACNWLVSDAAREMTRDAGVIELGAGTGVVSLCAALSGAARVAATDGDESAVRLAAENAQLHDVADRVTTRVLAWGDTDAAAGLAGEIAAAAPRGLRLLIASECVYSEECSPPLMRTAAAIVRAAEPGTPFVLSHAPRGMHQQGIDDALEAAARDAGFSWEILDNAALTTLSRGAPNTPGGEMLDNSSAIKQLSLAHFGQTKLYRFSLRDE